MIESQPTQDDKTLGILTHLSGIFFSIIVPLIVWLISKETKPWLSNQSKEALNFQITVLIGYLIGSALTFVLIGIFVCMAVWVLNVVFCIMAAIAVSQGREYRYPMTLRLVK